MENNAIIAQIKPKAQAKPQSRLIKEIASKNRVSVKRLKAAGRRILPIVDKLLAKLNRLLKMANSPV